jgi:hypothetical protein
MEGFRCRTLCKTHRLLICISLVILSHFKEEARKDQDRFGGFKCITEPREDETFEICVYNSVKIERLELETLLLEREMFSAYIDVMALEAETWSQEVPVANWNRQFP